MQIIYKEITQPILKEKHWLESVL